MNQYAFYLAMKKKYPEVSIKAAVADKWLSKGQHNGFELNKVFNIAVEEASIEDINRLANFYVGSGTVSKIINKYRTHFNSRKTQITFDDPTVYHPEVFQLDVSRDWFFWGNYVNERYYSDFSNELRSQFVFPDKLDAFNQKILSEIRITNSVSIHIRRGDYLEEGFTVLSIDYYKKAIKLIDTKVSNAKYYIFSDDKKYINENFNFINNKTIISHNTGENSYIDMLLMSFCKHNIIANSGFSYWAAWLNSNNEKIVLAPNILVPWCKNPVASSQWQIINCR